MSRAIAAVLVLVAILAAPAACAITSDKTSTSVWDLQQGLSPITLDSSLIYVSGTGVRLANSATSGVAGFYGTDAPFPTNWAVGSWNVDMPTGTGIRIEIRGVNGGSSTSWYEIARQGTVSDSISRVKGSHTNGIYDDTLILNTSWPRIEYRVTLYTNTIGVTPTLRLMSLCYADTNTQIPYVELPNPGYTVSLPVPWRSQDWSTIDPGEICGPTSMSMAMAYNGINLATETIVVEEKDTYNDMYGNWPFIAQEAAKYGFKSYYCRANGQQPLRDFFAQGIPVEFGMAYSAGQLSNSPIPSTAGHLVMCVGVTANGDYICCDPASLSSAYDHVVYAKSEIALVWLTHSGTMIPCIPNSVKWRWQYYPYKSTDQMSTNKDGKTELFLKGVDGHIYHMLQTSMNGSWGSWSSLGGTALSDPVAVTNRTGGNAVFARFSDGNLYYSSQNTTAGAWPGWVNLGGPIAGRPSVGKSPDGRMDVFCRMADGTIQHRWEDTSGGWQAWASLSGNVTADPVVALNWEGREEVFVRGTDNQLYHKYQYNDGTWSGWSSLGGTLGGDPSIGMTSDGRIEVFCRFTDGSTRRNWQSGRIVGTSWNGWTSLADPTTHDVAVARRPGFTEDAYYRDSTGQFVHVKQTAVDGSFGTPETLAVSSIGAPILGHNENGTQQVFYFQGDGTVYGLTQQSNGSWTGPTAYGGALFYENTAPVTLSITTNPYSVAAGDNVGVTVVATDNIGVASVTANGANLTNTGGNTWYGTFPASSVLGGHQFPVVTRDACGNFTQSTRGYRTLRVVATNTRGIRQMTSTAASNYLFAVCGKARVVNSGLFRVDDGSGQTLDVYAANHGVVDGHMVRVRGILTKTAADAHIDTTAAMITSLD